MDHIQHLLCDWKDRRVTVHLQLESIKLFSQLEVMMKALKTFHAEKNQKQASAPPTPTGVLEGFPGAPPSPAGVPDQSRSPLVQKNIT